MVLYVAAVQADSGKGRLSSEFPAIQNPFLGFNQRVANRGPGKRETPRWPIRLGVPTSVGALSFVSFASRPGGDQDPEKYGLVNRNFNLVVGRGAVGTKAFWDRLAKLLPL